MSSNRFYIQGVALKSGAVLELPVDTGKQVARVLRMKQGDELVLFNGSGYEFLASINSIDRDRVSVELGDAIDPGTEPTLQVTICQALIPAERMEFVIQKSTELGAARIVPVITERVQAKDRKVSDNRRNRWERIAVEAAEQSGRTVVPEILPAMSLADCLAEFSKNAPVILMWEEEHGLNLKAAIRHSLSSRPKGVTVLIGPVGGLSVNEANAAKEAGAVVAGAGRRILRAETAPIVALAVVMSEASELG